MKISSTWIGLLITVACFIIISFQIDIEKFWQAFIIFDLKFIYPCVMLLFLSYMLKILRWSIILKSKKNNISFSSCIPPFLASIAINNLIPFRLGDILRGLVFCRIMNIPKTVSIGSLIIEKTLDVISLIFIIGISMSFMRDNLILKNITINIWIWYMLIVCFFFLIFRFFKYLNFQTFIFNTINNSIKFFPKKIQNIFKRFYLVIIRMTELRVILVISCISILIWLCEGTIFYFVLYGLDLKISFFLAMIFMAVATLSTVLPSSPGYFGTFHLAAFTIALTTGISKDSSLAFAVIIHLVLWFPTTIIGLFYISKYPNLWMNKKTEY